MSRNYVILLEQFLGLRLLRRREGSAMAVSGH